MTQYDQWLMDLADQANTPCEPKVVDVHLEPSDDTISRENIFNCENCQECNCEYWEEYNDFPERQAEMDEALLWDI